MMSVPHTYIEWYRYNVSYMYRIHTWNITEFTYRKEKSLFSAADFLQRWGNIKDAQHVVTMNEKIVPYYECKKKKKKQQHTRSSANQHVILRILFRFFFFFFFCIGIQFVFFFCCILFATVQCITHFTWQTIFTITYLSRFKCFFLSMPKR